MKAPCAGCGKPISIVAKSLPVGVATCQACRRVAKAEPKTMRPLAPCGSLAAYVRHRRHGETPCRACRAAHNAQVRKYTRTAPAERPGRQCEACRKPLPRHRSRYCSEACRPARLWTPVWPRDCTACQHPFIARHPLTTTCSRTCSRRRRNRSDAYHRLKSSGRRSLMRDRNGGITITPRQEAAMRKRARRCPLCGARMTNESNRPNSKHLDHIVPLGIGGTHTHGNGRIICRTCNLRRPKDGSDYAGPVTLWSMAQESGQYASA